MNELNIIAVEKPFLINYGPSCPVNACALKDGKLHVYTCEGELLPGRDYFDYIYTLDHIVKENKYEWSDFHIAEGSIICRDYEDEIILNDKRVDMFQKLNEGGKSKISCVALKLFNDFLKESNKDNPDLVKALELSLSNGFFRTEVDDIIKNDKVEKLSELDRQIIIRCRLEGRNYVKKYIDKLMASSRPDNLVDANYFFRRLFNLEANNYISLN
jgi:hypothetical protein